MADECTLPRPSFAAACDLQETKTALAAYKTNKQTKTHLSHSIGGLVFLQPPHHCILKEGGLANHALQQSASLARTLDRERKGLCNTKL